MGIKEKIKHYFCYISDDAKELNNMTIMIRSLCIANIIYIMIFTIIMMIFFRYSEHRNYVALISIVYVFILGMTYITKVKYTSVCYCITNTIMYFYLSYLFGAQIGFNFSILVLIFIIFYDTRESLFIKIIYTAVISVLALMSWYSASIISNGLVTSYSDIGLVSMIHIMYTAAEMILIAQFYYIKFAKTEESIVQYAIKLENMVNTDALTHLLNRRGFYNEFDKLKRDTMVAVMCDIDFFKKVNDTYGHEAGDDVLICISEILNKLSRKNTLVSRWGGEEFLLLFYDTNIDNVYYTIEGVRIDIQNYIIHSGNNDIKVTMSFGMYEFVKGDVQIDNAINDADKLLYLSKTSGRNKITH